MENTFEPLDEILKNLAGNTDTITNSGKNPERPSPVDSESTVQFIDRYIDYLKGRTDICDRVFEEAKESGYYSDGQRYTQFLQDLNSKDNTPNTYQGQDYTKLSPIQKKASLVGIAFSVENVIPKDHLDYIMKNLAGKTDTAETKEKPVSYVVHSNAGIKPENQKPAALPQEMYGRQQEYKERRDTLQAIQARSVLAMIGGAIFAYLGFGADAFEMQMGCWGIGGALIGGGLAWYRNAQDKLKYL